MFIRALLVLAFMATPFFVMAESATLLTPPSSTPGTPTTVVAEDTTDVLSQMPPEYGSEGSTPQQRSSYIVVIIGLSLFFTIALIKKIKFSHRGPVPPESR